MGKTTATNPDFHDCRASEKVPNDEERGGSFMIRVLFLRVREGTLDRLRWWMNELNRRKDEVLKTFSEEGMRHIVAYLVQGKEGPILVWAMEADDFERANSAFEASKLPIDLEHKQVMEETTWGKQEPELLYECHASTRIST
jgi:hypothetical protein